jgi:hypothetical protein
MKKLYSLIFGLFLLFSFTAPSYEAATVYDTILLRRGTSTAWSTANPVLAQGEPGFETDTNRLKIGDGLTHWNSLAYLFSGSAVQFQAVIDCSGTPNYPAATAGWFYVVSVAGKIGGASGTAVQPGDTIICLTSNAGGTQAAVGADFSVVVTSANMSTDATLGASSPSDAVYPSQKAVKTYVDTEVGINAASYSTLALANTAAYAAGKFLIISQNFTLPASTTLTAAIKVLPGGGFTKASTYTLTVNGPFEAGLYQVFTGFTAGVTFGGAVREIPVQWFGALGTGGASDDTVAFQSAIYSAIGKTLVIPQPSATYNIADELILKHPTAGQYLYMNIRAEGPYTQITWTGANSKSIFHSYGWATSSVEGLKISLTSKTSVVVWDISDDPSWTSSTTGLTFRNCLTRFVTCTTCVNFRGGSATGSNCEDMIFENFAIDSTVAGGNIGWQPIHQSCLGWTWIGGHGNYLSYIYDGYNTIYAGNQGGGDAHFYNFSGSHNDTDFRFVAGGAYSIVGGRYEVGKRFIARYAAGGTGNLNIALHNVTIDSYTFTSNIGIHLSASTSLSLVNCIVTNTGGSDYTAAFITTDGDTAAAGSITIVGGTYQAADPFYTHTFAGVYKLSMIGVAVKASDGTVTAWFPDRMTNFSTTSASTGAGTIKMGSTNPANSAGFIKIADGVYVPYFTTPTP